MHPSSHVRLSAGIMLRVKSYVYIGQCTDAEGSVLLTMALLVRHSIEPFDAPVLPRYTANGPSGQSRTSRRAYAGRIPVVRSIVASLVWACLSTHCLLRMLFQNPGPKAVGKHCRRHCVQPSPHEAQSRTNRSTLLVSEPMRKKPPKNKTI